MNIRPLCVFSAALVALVTVVAVSCTAALANAGTVTKLALIKDNDLANIGSRFARNFKWITCGRSTGTRCKHGQVPTYASYWAFKSAIRAGRLDKGDVLLFDQEPWAITPRREQDHPAHYAKLVSQMASAHDVRLIFTGVEKGEAGELAVYEAAAPYAFAVAVQSQRYDAHPAQFGRYIHRAVKALRGLSPKTTILAGLATDAGGRPVSVTDMLREYRAAYPLVAGFWLNSAVWPAPRGKGCAPKGCGALGAKFLRLIRAKT